MLLRFSLRLSHWFCCGLLIAAQEKALAAQEPSGDPLLLGPALEKALQVSTAQTPHLGFVAAEADESGVKYYSAGDLGVAGAVPPERIEFEIGSITKVFTCLLLAQAVVEHRVSLEDPIGRFLPDSVKLSPSVEAITLRQLATHTSGLPRLPDNSHPSDQWNPYADYRTENLYQYLESVKSIAPSKQANYSNLGTGLLGHILTLVYKKPYAALLAEKITEPLGLEDTAVELDSKQEARCTPPHDGGQVIEAWTFDSLAGCGSIRSTAGDLMKFSQALLSETSPLTAAWAIVRRPEAPFGPDQQVGLAVIQKTVKGIPTYWHDGGTGGYRSYWAMSPQPKHVLIVLSNNNQGDAENLADSLYRPKAEKPALVKDHLARKPIALSRQQLAEYVGVYGPVGGPPDAQRFTVVIDDTNGLRWRLTGHSFRSLLYEGKDRFFNQTTTAEAEFERAPDRTITEMTVTENGHATTLTRTDAQAPVVRFLKAADLKAYLGDYKLGENRRFEITLKYGQLYARITGQEACPVFADNVPDHFVYDLVEASLTFERDGAGAVAGLVLHQNGRDQRAPRIIEKLN